MKKFKNIILAVLIAVFTVSASGCLGGEPEYKIIDPGELPHKMEVIAPVDPMPRYEKTVTINVLGMDYPAEDPDIPSNLGPKTQSFNDIALEKLNIKLNYISAVTPAQYETQLNLLINTGSIPDVFATSNPIVYELVRTSGYVTDLKDQFYNLNEDLQKLYLNDYYSSLQACMDEGSLYAFPAPANPYEYAKRIYIRKDWMKTVGKQVPTTTEELIALAKAFKNNASTIAATMSGVKATDIVPIGIHKDLSYVDNYGPTGLFELFGTQVGSYLQGTDGKLYASDTSNEMKTAVKVIADMYKDKLIDQNFYTYTSNKVASDVIAGKIGIVFGDWWVPEYPLGNSVINNRTPGADWIGIELVGYGGAKGAPIVKPITINNYNVISKTCQYPEALPRLINLFYDVYYNDNAIEIYGAKATPAGGFFHNWVPVKVWNTSASIQEHYRVLDVFDKLYKAGYVWETDIAESTTANKAAVDAEIQAQKEYLENDETFAPIFNRLKAREKNLHFTKGYLYFQGLKAGKRAGDMIPREKAGFGIYEEMIAPDGGYAYVAKLAEGKADAKYNCFYGTPTTSMQSKGEYITKELVSTFSKIIVGEKNMNDWDKFVSNYNKNGGTKILKEVNVWYASQPKGV